MPRIQSVNDQTYPLLESFSEQTVQRSELISVSWYNDTTDKIGTHRLLTRTVSKGDFVNGTPVMRAERKYVKTDSASA